MSIDPRQFVFLLAAVIVGNAASSAEAGYLSFDDLAALNGIGVLDASSTMSTGEGPDENQNSSPPAILAWDQFQVGNAPSGGMSSSSPVTGGSAPAPAAILTAVSIPKTGLTAPLSLREIPFSPLLMIADIFRPPRA